MGQPSGSAISALICVRRKPAILPARPSSSMAASTARSRCYASHARSSVRQILVVTFPITASGAGENMTTRMSFMYVAMAAAPLMISNGGATRAATKFCDIYPERCQYSGDGVNYFYPLGYRMPGSTAPRSPIVRKMPAATARKTANMITHKTLTIPAHKGQLATTFSQAGLEPFPRTKRHLTTTFSQAGPDWTEEDVFAATAPTINCGTSPSKFALNA